MARERCPAGSVQEDRPPFEREYFEGPVPTVDATYRVSVIWITWFRVAEKIDGGGQGVVGDVVRMSES